MFIRGRLAVRQHSRSVEVTLSPGVLRDRAAALFGRFRMGRFDNGELSCRSGWDVRVILVLR